MPSSGVAPATFRLVACCLNQLRYRVQTWSSRELSRNLSGGPNRKPRKDTVMIADVPAKIRTEYLPNTSLEWDQVSCRFLHTNNFFLFHVQHFSVRIGRRKFMREKYASSEGIFETFS